MEEEVEEDVEEEVEGEVEGEVEEGVEEEVEEGEGGGRESNLPPMVSNENFFGFPTAAAVAICNSSIDDDKAKPLLMTREILCEEASL